MARPAPGLTTAALRAATSWTACRPARSGLQTDHIDLYQIHGDDPVTPIDETLRALDDLTRQGLVRYIGVSNWQAWRIAKALGISEARDYARFETLQAYYSIAGRDLERELVPLMNSEKLGLMVWSPLAGGYLSGKYSPGGEGAGDGRRASFDFPPIDRTRADACVEVMREVGKARGASPARVALAWLLAKPHVMSVIIGAKTIGQLDDNLAAVDLQLTSEEVGQLDQVSELAAEYPGWMLARQGGHRVPKPFQKP
jgi:aryl-alcohol dehydrogenase-like predicted oxidoreductase